MSLPEENQAAPSFQTTNQDGAEVSLSDYKGKTVVLYFYPKDDTPGCTKEACGFRDGYDALKKAGLVILGVSPDGSDSHRKFIDKYSLPFDLLTAEDHSIAEAYGVWVEKSMYGKTFMGVERSTFIIGSDGKIIKILRKVKPDGHADEILSLVK